MSRRRQPRHATGPLNDKAGGSHPSEWLFFALRAASPAFARLLERAVLLWGLFGVPYRESSRNRE